MTAADTEAPHQPPPGPGAPTCGAPLTVPSPVSRRVGRRLAEFDRRPRASLRGRLAPGAAGRREAAAAVPDRRSPRVRHVRGRARVAADRPRPGPDPAASVGAHHAGRPRRRPDRHRHPGPSGRSDRHRPVRPGHPARGGVRGDHPGPADRWRAGGCGDASPTPAASAQAERRSERRAERPCDGRPSPRVSAAPSVSNAPGSSASPRPPRRQPPRAPIR